MPHTKKIRKKDGERKAKELEEIRDQNEQVARIQARDRAKGSVAGGAPAMNDPEMPVSTLGEEQTLEEQIDALVAEVGDKERKKSKMERVREHRAKKHAQRLADNAEAEIEAGGVGESTATAMEDVEITTPAQEQDVSQIQAEGLAKEVEGKKRKKKWNMKKEKKRKKSGDSDGEKVGGEKDSDETLQAPDDLPASKTGHKKSTKAKKRSTEKNRANLSYSSKLENEEAISTKPTHSKKKGKQKAGQDSESDRTVEEEPAEEERNFEESIKDKVDRLAQEDREEAERKRLERNEKSKEYKRKRAGEKRLEAAQKKVQDTLATTLANLGMSPRRSQSLELVDWRTRGESGTKEATVDMTEYEPGLEEEWMKLLQDSAPDDQKLGDENDADWDDVDSDEECIVQDTALSGIFDDGRPIPKMNDFMKKIYSTIQNAASVLTTPSGTSTDTSTGPSVSPKKISSIGPSTPPKKIRPTRNLQQEAHHFSHSHPFYSDGAWIHTISDRRAYERDVYDYLRAKGFSLQAVNSNVMTHQLRDDWIEKFGPKDYDRGSDESAFGDREVDDSETILAKLQESIKLNMTPSSKRKWDLAEALDARTNGGEEQNADGTPSTGKRRKNVTFAKDVKNDDGGSTLIPRHRQASKTIILTDGKESTPPALDDIIEDLMGKVKEDVPIQDQRDFRLDKRRETRKKIQKDFKKSKAATWVSEQRPVEAEKRDIVDASMNLDIPTHNELPASSWFAGHRSLVIDQGDLAVTSMNPPLKQTLSKNHHPKIQKYSAEDTTRPATVSEKEEELILPTADLSSPSTRKRALVSRIDILAEDLKEKASYLKGEPGTEAPKQKKRKRKSKSPDEDPLTVDYDESLLKDKTVDVEETENAGRKKKLKKRKSKSVDNETVDFLTPMIQEA